MRKAQLKQLNSYRWCFLLMNKNTTKSAPSKVFVTVPRDEATRRGYGFDYPDVWTHHRHMSMGCTNKIELFLLGGIIFLKYPIFEVSRYIDNILRFMGIVCLNIFHSPIRLQKRNPSGSGLDLSFCVRERRMTFVIVSLSHTRSERPKPETLRVSLENE